MCGIAGFIDYSDFSNLEVLRNMSASLKHRGPDGEGHFFQEFGSCKVGLAHTRLAIVDLTEMGGQPMYLDEFAIVFNGEIYNFNEIRIELESLGQNIKSKTDTEVILHAFKMWGINCLDKFIGMFSFVLFDSKAMKVYLVRDRLGVKPLYYYIDDEVFIFASELKAILCHGKYKKEINVEALNCFFQDGYISNPNCIFNSTYKVSAGHYLEFSLNSKISKIHCYWDVFDYLQRPKLEISYANAKKKLKEILVSSFNYRLVSDVPVVVLLSGGVDSSLLTSILSTNNNSKIETFTVAFESGNDESGIASEIAKILDVRNIQIVCSDRNISTKLNEMVTTFDEPFADSSAIPTMIIAEAIRSAGFKVALSADGGDENFGGYLFYKKFITLHKILQKYFTNYFVRKTSLFLLKRVLKLKWARKNLSIYNKLEFLFDILNKGNFTFELLHKFYLKRSAQMTKVLKSEYIEKPVINKEFQNDYSDNLLALDIKKYLEGDILTKVDRSMMRYSVESREPLLDHRIVEYAFQLPHQFKYTINQSKLILKDILNEYLPSRIILKPKTGFSVNLEFYFRNSLKSQFEKYINDECLQEIPYLNVNEINKLKLNYYEHGKNFDILYKVYIFSAWYNNIMKSN
jgi:asparagine synthase (glutamine-hydrolysing)